MPLHCAFDFISCTSHAKLHSCVSAYIVHLLKSTIDTFYRGLLVISDTAKEKAAFHTKPTSAVPDGNFDENAYLKGGVQVLRTSVDKPRPPANSGERHYDGNLQMPASVLLHAMIGLTHFA